MYQYSTLYAVPLSRRSGMDSSVACNYTNACLYLVSVHQMAPPQTEVANISLQPTTHLSTPKGRKAESAWLAELQRTVYPHKWSPVNCRSSAGQGKFASQRPTFYHCTTQPTNQHVTARRANAKNCIIIQINLLWGNMI